MIVREAVRFFAEVGFEGQTRILADRMGVTQPLLYRYFPDKDALIDRVYEEVFLNPWQAEWDDLIRDRARPLVERLNEFYKVYVEKVFTYEWIRLFVLFGLKNPEFNTRYLGSVRNRIIMPVLTESRAEAGLPSPDKKPITDLEIEVALNLDGGLFHIALRKWICLQDPSGSMADIIGLQAKAYAEGLKAIQRHLLA